MIYWKLSTKYSNYNKKIICAVVTAIIASTSVYLFIDNTFICDIPPEDWNEKWKIYSHNRNNNYVIGTVKNQINKTVSTYFQ